MNIAKLSEDILEGKEKLEDHVAFNSKKFYYKNPIMTLERLFDADVKYLYDHDVYEVTLKKNLETRYLSYVNWSRIASSKYSNDVQIIHEILPKLSWGISKAIDA